MALTGTYILPMAVGHWKARGKAIAKQKQGHWKAIGHSNKSLHHPFNGPDGDIHPTNGCRPLEIKSCKAIVNKEGQALLMALTGTYILPMAVGHWKAIGKAIVDKGIGHWKAIGHSQQSLHAIA
jgi:hypothetical protein